MKKKIIIISSIVVTVLVVACSLLFIFKPWGKKPFKNIKTEDIKSVSVELLPPNVTEELSNEEIIEFVEILNTVVIYNEDNSYTEYNGQAVIFTITKTDGSTVTVNAYNPFIVIDGVGYKCLYEPTEELSNFADSLQQ